MAYGPQRATAEGKVKSTAVTLGTGVWSDLDSSSAKAVLQTLIQPLSFEVLSQARSVTGNGIQDGR